MLGRFFNKAVSNGAKKLRSYAGDKTFLSAAVSFAANIIKADGKVEDDELKKATRVINDHPIIKGNFSVDEIKRELDDALDRAETRGGRRVNSELIGKIKERELADREAIFLIGADVADVNGLGEDERRELMKGADVLGVDGADLLG